MYPDNLQSWLDYGQGLWIFSCDQAALWMVQSVRPCVCHTVLIMFPSSYHHEIFRSHYQWRKWHPCKGQGQSSKVKVTEVNTQLSSFWTVTPVWIHRWWWNDAQSLMLLRRGALLFFKVTCQISRRMHGGNGLKFCMLIYPDHFQNWLYLGHALLIFLIMVSLWVSESGHIWGLRALSREHLGVNVEGGAEAYFGCFASSSV